MRFVITGEWKHNQLLKLIIVMFLVFMIAFWLTNLLLFFEQMAFDHDVVVAHYLGKATEFAPAVARSYKVLLEVSHGHLFAMGLLVMTLTHLLLFVPASNSVKAMLTIATFLSALLDESAGWLICYVHPAFAYLKLAAFASLQLSLGAIIILVFGALVRSEKIGTHTYRSIPRTSQKR